MADCECLSGCPFFNDRMPNMPSLAESLKRRFCKGDSTNCARYLVFKKLGKPKVPADLGPSQKERALEIIRRG